MSTWWENVLPWLIDLNGTYVIFAFLVLFVLYEMYCRVKTTANFGRLSKNEKQELAKDGDLEEIKIISDTDSNEQANVNEENEIFDQVYIMLDDSTETEISEIVSEGEIKVTVFGIADNNEKNVNADLNSNMKDEKKRPKQSMTAPIHKKFENKHKHGSTAESSGPLSKSVGCNVVSKSLNGVNSMEIHVSTEDVNYLHDSRAMVKDDKATVGMTPLVQKENWFDAARDNTNIFEERDTDREGQLN